jgi:hypothetical protein
MDFELGFVDDADEEGRRARGCITVLMIEGISVEGICSSMRLKRRDRLERRVTHQKQEIEQQLV